MPIDRAFASVERNRLKHTKVLTPEEWINIVRSARVTRPFRIYNLNFPLTSDLNSLPDVQVVGMKDYKSACGARAKQSSFAKIRAIRFQRNYAAMFQTIPDDPWNPITLLKRGQNRYASLNAQEIGLEIRPAKSAKKKNVDEQIRESRFYESICAVEDSPEALEEYEAY